MIVTIYHLLSGDEKAPKPPNSAAVAATRATDVQGSDVFGLIGHSLKGSTVSGAKKSSSDDPNDFFKERLLKPLPDFGGNRCSHPSPPAF
jgi:hypothetical protein